MNLAPVEAIAKAVLYEGYILYPYRASNVKNQRADLRRRISARLCARTKPVPAKFRRMSSSGRHRD